MNLIQLISCFSELSCQKVYVKRLSPNDNSKNQVYLGGSFDVLNILPTSKVLPDNGGIRKRNSFKAKIDFFWLNPSGVFPAKHSQLILYPDYPEVRLSGFLLGCENAPSSIMTSRIENRILFLGVSLDRKIYGYVALPDAEVFNEFQEQKNLETHGVFSVLTIADGKILANAKNKLLRELKRINELGWIESKRLTPTNEIVPCESSNCGGFTLEAELKIRSNSKSEPDYLGWELKNFRVKNFSKIGSSIITLMDHSPSGGFFYEHGAEAFIRRFGYPDRKGREARMNFGGIHKLNTEHPLTALKLEIVGYDVLENKFLDPNGYVALIDNKDIVAAAWSFSSIIDHWTQKHTNACYVPSQINTEYFINHSKRQYRYGSNIIMGSYTDISLFLKQLVLGNIYYDPGIKLEMAIKGSRGQSVKVRSLFRTKSQFLTSLYQRSEVIDLKKI